MKRKILLKLYFLLLPLILNGQASPYASIGVNNSYFTDVENSEKLGKTFGVGYNVPFKLLIPFELNIGLHLQNNRTIEKGVSVYIEKKYENDYISIIDVNMDFSLIGAELKSGPVIKLLNNTYISPFIGYNLGVRIKNNSNSVFLDAIHFENDNGAREFNYDYEPFYGEVFLFVYTSLIYGSQVDIGNKIRLEYKMNKIMTPISQYANLNYEHDMNTYELNLQYLFKRTNKK